MAESRYSCLKDAPYTELWELSPLAHARRGRFLASVGPLLHALLIGALTAQTILLVNSSALFGLETHANWAAFLFPDGATDDFGGTPLSFPDDEFFAYRSSLVLDTLETVFNGYFTRLSGSSADAHGFYATSSTMDGSSSRLDPPVISFTTFGWTQPTNTSLAGDAPIPDGGFGGARRRASQPQHKRRAGRRRRRAVPRSSATRDIGNDSSGSRAPDLLTAVRHALPSPKRRLQRGEGDSRRRQSPLSTRASLPDSRGDRVTTTITSLADFGAWRAAYAQTPAQWAALVQVGGGLCLTMGGAVGGARPGAWQQRRQLRAASLRPGASYHRPSFPSTPPPPAAAAAARAAVHVFPVRVAQRARLQRRPRRIHP